MKILEVIDIEIDRLESLLEEYACKSLLDKVIQNSTKNGYDILMARLQGLLYAKRAIFLED